jgi:hypothetical protein
LRCRPWRPEYESNFDFMGISGLSMPASRSSPFDAVARDWLALVERRRAHLIELFETGRWTHYFTEAQFLAQLRAANLARDRFAKVAGFEPTAPSSSV